MQKTGILLAAAFLLASCGNGRNKERNLDTIPVKDTLMPKTDGTSNAVTDSANAMEHTARKMLDTVNTNISAVPLDSVKK